MDEEEKYKVLEDYGGIIPMYEAFYLVFLKTHAEQCTTAYRLYCDYWSMGRKENSIMMACEMLRQAAALSRYFFPVHTKRKLHRLRAARLRNAFEVEDDSPLSDRRLRNAVEHLDERLDEYLFEPIAGPIIPFMVDDDEVTDQDLALGHLFLFSNPKTHEFIVLNERFNYGPLIEEVFRIQMYLETRSFGDSLPRN